MSNDTTTDNTPEEHDEEEIAVDSQGGSNRASWPTNGANVNRATAHLPEEERELIRWFFAFSIERNDSMRTASEKVGVDASTVFRVLKGTYVNAEGVAIVPLKLLKGIRALRKEEERRLGLERGEFAMTPTAKKIFRGCDIARTSGRIVMVWGKSQTGKTTALREYQRRNNHGTTRYLRIVPSSGAPTLLRQLAHACALRAEGNVSAIRERVSRALDKHNLLIVDEIHLFTYTFSRVMKLSCLELLRWLHDETGCGVVLCGTNVWRDDLQKGKDALVLEQLERRGAIQVQLPDEPTKGDLTAIFKTSKLDYPEGETDEVIAYLAKTKGLTMITELLRFGAKIAADMKEPLTWEHVMDAQEILADLAKGRDEK